jgi:hypothetical protein
MVQPPIPTSIPSTADSAYEPDSAVATGPVEAPPRRRRPVRTALWLMLAILVTIVLWRIGDDRTKPAPDDPDPPRMGALDTR